MKRFIAGLVTLFTLTLSVSAFAAKSVDDTVYDASLNVVKSGATMAVFCSAAPANYAGVAAVALVVKTGLTSSNYTGPADDTSGRKLTVNAITGMTPASNGTVTYMCLTNGTTTSNGSVLYGCTTTTSQAVTTSQSWDSPAIKINFQDPT